MPMKEWLLKHIKKIAERIETKVIDIILLALFGGTLGVLAFSETALDYFLLILNTPTPLWATIALVLLSGLYIYLKPSKVRASLTSSSLIVEYLALLILYSFTCNNMLK